MKTEIEIIDQWDRKDDAPLVSILCITYNHELYIREAINSFLNQETTFPFEIIIHDDASNDKSKLIIENYKQKYPSIIKTFFQEENQYSKHGFAFLNNLIKECSGDYVAFCEGDDYWINKGKLQEQADFLTKNTDYSMVIHNAYIYNSTTEEKTIFNKSMKSRDIKIYDILLRRWFSPTASFFLRKSHLTFPKSKIINADIAILFNASLMGKIFYDEKIMSIYRYLSESSLSLATKNSKKILYARKYEFIKYVDKKTKYKYILITSLARVKIILGLIKYLIKSSH